MRIAGEHEAQALLAGGPMNKDVQALSKFFVHQPTFLSPRRNLQRELAYRATLADTKGSDLPDVPPLVRTAEVHRKVRLVAGNPALRRGSHGA